MQQVFCRSSGIFSQRDIESLRRNKRALLLVSAAIRAAIASMPSESHDATERDGASANRLLMLQYRAIKRENLKVSSVRECAVVVKRLSGARRRHFKPFCRATIG